MPESAVLLDANLLVLLAVGLASPAHIATHKRLGEYSTKDFDLLRELLSKASGVVVTPNTLTEAVNLGAYIAEPARSLIMQAFRQLLTGFTEIYIGSAQASRHVAFVRLGLTDCVVLEAATANHVIVTADLGLYLEAGRQGREAINFNHYRDRFL
jgi:hypothetical protein